MAKKAKETPLMKQYNQIKAKYPDAMLLFRVGDFYETFGEGSTFPQVQVDGKKLGGCVDTIEFLRENKIAK